MSAAVISIVVTLAISSTATADKSAVSIPSTRAPFDVAMVVPASPVLDEATTPPQRRSQLSSRPPLDAWKIDRRESRPAPLPAMYATFAALQVLDVYSTRRALSVPGAYEANPVMRKVAGNSGAMLAVKAASTAATIYFTERAWKKNRKGAVIVMAIINGATAAVASRNLKLGR